MSIRTIRLSNGERLTFLAETPWAAPDPWVAAYAIRALRGKVSSDTMGNALEGIARGLDFCRKRSIADLPRHASECAFSSNDLTIFANACGKRLDGTGTIVNGAQHYTAFLDFYLWLGDEGEASFADRDRRLLHRAALVERIGKNRPMRETEPSVRTGFTAKQRDLFLRVILPGQAGNPFKSSAYRNFALMSTASLLGLRSGELLGLKLADLELCRGVGRIHVVRRRNDPDDPRRRPAAQKTLARTLSISERLVQILIALLEQRGTLRAARSHPYLFCNADGAPLGDRGLRKAYATLRKQHPELADLINHQLRHDWNEQWQRKVDEMGWDFDRALNAQIQAMGWSPNSSMPNLYSKAARQEIAGRYLIEAQNHGLSPKQRTGKAA